MTNKKSGRNLFNLLGDARDDSHSGDGDDATDGKEAEDEGGGEMSDLSSFTSASRSRQLDAGTLDAKVVKALKKQEEKRDKRMARKKEVR